LMKVNGRLLGDASLECIGLERVGLEARDHLEWWWARALKARLLKGIGLERIMLEGLIRWAYRAARRSGAGCPR
jgi:hypothetical protein